LLVDLFFLCAPCWEYELSLESIIEYAPLDVIVIVVVVVANHPCSSLPQNLK